MAWDSFTHWNGWAVEHIPLLQRPLFAWDGMVMPAFMLLKFASGLGGLAFLGGWLLHWARRQQRGAYWPTLPAKWQIICALGIALCSAAMGLGNAVRFYSLQEATRTVVFGLMTGVVGLITGFCVSVVIYALAVSLLEAKGRLRLAAGSNF